ncbi:MAG: hypothetical protein ACYS8Y_11710 [Planctomycetota bacterium]|jgi:hypothetical protein
MVDYVFGVRLAGDSFWFSCEYCNGFGSAPELDMSREEATLSKSKSPTSELFNIFRRVSLSNMVDYVFGVKLAGDSFWFSCEYCNGFGSAPELDMSREEATLSKSKSPKGK